MTQPEPGSAEAPASPSLPPLFRVLWVASLASSVGTWMQTIGAQWFLVEHHASPLLITLVQTATALPVLLLGIPAGVVGEMLNRRRLLIGVQAWQVVISVALTVLTFTGHASPTLLLVLTFLLGAASAVQIPAYQTLAAETVPAATLPRAASWSSVAVNLSRAFGPPLAGVIVAVLGVPFVFAANILAFALLLVVLMCWRRYTARQTQAEPFISATRAGVRYVTHSGVVRRIIIRLAAFVMPASALYALLPLVATERLGYGVAGYGALLAALGVGSLAAALQLRRLLTRLGLNRLVMLSTVGFGAGTITTALSPTAFATVPALVIAGAGWIGVVAPLNSATQTFLPRWVRTRGLSVYQMVVFGASAVGALLSGAVASITDAGTACTVAGILTVLIAGTQLRWPVINGSNLRRDVTSMPFRADQTREPVDDRAATLVIVTYTVAANHRTALLQLLRRVESSRRRTGARRWRTYQERENPDVIVEAFTVGSWREHLEQHETRLTAYDHDLLTEAAALATDTTVRHLTATAIPHPATDHAHVHSATNTRHPNHTTELEFH